MVLKWNDLSDEFKDKLREYRDEALKGQKSSLKWSLNVYDGYSLIDRAYKISKEGLDYLISKTHSKVAKLIGNTCAEVKGNEYRYIFSFKQGREKRILSTFI